jgi:hypothetical protein
MLVRLLVAAVAAMSWAPSAFLLRFELRRAYVERELCVQRALAGDMRTCHGECHLGQQLKALEQEAGQSFPGERLQLRTEPAVEPALPARAVMRAALVLVRAARMAPALCAGYRSPSEPVPWG